MGKNKKKSKKANVSRTRPEEAPEILNALFKQARRPFQWESLYDQEHSQGELEEMLSTKPEEFKHCKLKMERHDLAYAKPLDDPTCAICINGKENVGRSFPGDEVCVQILSREIQPHQGESLKGKVVGLLQRSEECCTVICRMEGFKQLVTPVRNNMTRICILQKERDKIEIRKSNPRSGRFFTEKCIDITEDQLLVVKVLKWEKNRRYPLGAVTKVISQEEYFDELLKLEKKGTPPSFQPRSDQEEDENRRDFRNDLTFTIDSSNAQDLDDGISLADKGEQYMLAIHITDVARYVRKDSREDTFAKEQGRTIYPPHEVQANPEAKPNPAFMLCREASSEYLSLLPGKNRKAISLVIMINKATSMIESSSFTLSNIMSNKRLSYEQADKIIQERSLDDHEAPLSFSSVEDCVAVAYRFSKVLRQFRLEGSWSSGQRKGDSRARCMVEELMNFYNNAVAEELISKDLTRDFTPLRCHFKPDPELLEKFKEKYSILLPLSPYLSQICEVTEEEPEETKAKETFIHVFTPVFQQMKALTQQRDYHKLAHLIIADEIHPTLSGMANEFKKIQNKSVILRSCSNMSSKLGHYDLQLNAYTWATSPMRRYLDLILQRLLHSVLSENQRSKKDYSKAEIDQFCDKCECTENFDLESLRFINVIKSCSRDVTKLAVLEQCSPKEHEFIISIPLDSVKRVMIKYNNLKVVEQPNHQDDSCTLSWKRRVYSYSETVKPQPRSEINKNVIPISVKNWTTIISAVKDEDWDTVSECLQNVKEDNRKSMVISNTCPNGKNHFKEWNMELKLEEVLQVQLGPEVINGATLPAVNLLTVSSSFEVCLKHARNPIKCFTTTDDTVCRASKNKYRNDKEFQEIWGKICQMDTAYNAVEENNSVILEDVPITWTGITETALEGSFAITRTQTKNWSLELDLTNCYLCLRLRDHCVEKEEETEATQGNGSGLSDLQNTLPFTWVAHGVPIKPPTYKKKKQMNTDKKSPNIQVNFHINHHNMKNIPPTLQKQQTKFTVEVIPKKIPYVQREHAIHSIIHANDLVKSIATGTVLKASSESEELPSLPDHRDDKLDLQKLNKSQERAVRRALSNPFTVIQGPPGTGKTVVGVHITYHFYKKNKVLEAGCPNQPPRLAQDASLHVKTPKRRGILYCGPSNKSVDIVAEQLLKLRRVLKPLRIYCDQMEMREFPYPGSDLQLCHRSLRDDKPKEALRDISLMYLVRQPANPYSEEIKAYERKTEEFDTKGKEDCRRCYCAETSEEAKPKINEAKEALQEVLEYLMSRLNLIQEEFQPGGQKEYLQAKFFMVVIDGVCDKKMEESQLQYKEVLKKARKHELLKHDVILCTCSTALKPILMETMDFRQILIDECAMATEPEAFIPLVSHKPEQIVLLGDHKQIRPIVSCARVKELGMEKSLFERYMDWALMLDTQYRMHESICKFPSDEFYDGKLKTGTKQRPCLLLDKNITRTAIVFGHVEGEEISLAVSTAAGNEHSAANELEAERAVRVAELLINQSRVEPKDIAILTPYNAQMSKIKEMLAQKKEKTIQDVNVCTIMKSQGSEWHYVIISTVRSCALSEIQNEPYISKGWLGKKLGFITDPNQVNVAITRAQDGLCILGNRELLRCSGLWRRLLAHYQSNDCVLDAGDIKVVRRY